MRRYSCRLIIPLSLDKQSSAAFVFAFAGGKKRRFEIIACTAIWPNIEWEYECISVRHNELWRFERMQQSRATASSQIKRLKRNCARSGLNKSSSGSWTEYPWRETFFKSAKLREFINCRFSSRSQCVWTTLIAIANCNQSNSSSSTASKEKWFGIIKRNFSLHKFASFAI